MAATGFRHPQASPVWQNHPVGQDSVLRQTLAPRSTPQTLQPQPQAIVAAAAQQLTQRVRRRQQLVEMQVAEKNRLSRALPSVQADINEHIEQLQQRIEALNAQIETLAVQQQDGQRKQAILQSVKGIGKVTATLCLAEL